MKLRFELVLTFGFFATWVGCGSDSSSGGSTGELTEEQFFSAYAETICRERTPCCAAEGLTPNKECASAMLSRLEAQYGYGKNAPSIKAKYQPAAAAKCIAAIEKRQTECDALPARPDEDAACGTFFEKVFVGTLAPGATCTTNLDCGPPKDEPGRGRCGGSPGAGTCYHEIDTVDGASCDLDPILSGATSVHHRCGGNSFCGESSHLCEALPQVGQSCEDTFLCSDGLNCTGTPATCAPYPIAGEPCTSSCDVSSWCGPASVCLARQATGATCDPANSGEECLSLICTNGTCQRHPWTSVASDPALCTDGSAP